jgi:DNA-binding HxlR family transcriptional regulator
MVAKSEHRQRTGCPIAVSLDILGDHWTLLIIRNLMFNGAHEYKDMLKAEEQISSSILTNRLKKLESDGLIAQTPHPYSQRRKLYYLLPMGKDLVHTLVHLVLWANTHLDDHLAIPEEKKSLLESDPDAFIEATLKRLEDWEKQYLPAQ